MLYFTKNVSKPKSKPLKIGYKKGRKPVWLSAEDRTKHLHVIGASGRGKTKSLEFIKRQDIKNGMGGCYMDPHGHSYQELVKWCASEDSIDKKKILLFDPSDPNWSFGFNPLDFRGAASNDVGVDAVLGAFSQVWGGEDMNQTPRLKKVLRCIIHALVEKHLTLTEASYLLSKAPSNKKIRSYITSDLENENTRLQWEVLDELADARFLEQVESTNNRLVEFLDSEVVRTTIGQQKATIDLRSLMDNGYTILANLAPSDRLTDSQARLLGTLLINDLFLQARHRPEGSRPFSLVIDECSLFISSTIARILAEGRKFGLQLVLSHQTLQQLRTDLGNQVYDAVMTNAQNKVIFGGAHHQDTELLAQTIYAGQWNFEEPKETLITPTLVGHTREWLKNRGRGRGGATNWSSSHGTSDTMSSSVTRHSAEPSATEHYDQDGELLGSAETRPGVGDARAESVASQSTESDSDGGSESWEEHGGESESLIPVLEDRPGQVYSLQEQIKRRADFLARIPQRHAVFKSFSGPAVGVAIPEVKAVNINPKKVERFKEKCFNRATFALPLVDARNEIQARRLELERKAQGFIEAKKLAAEPPKRNRG